MVEAGRDRRAGIGSRRNGADRDLVRYLRFQPRVASSLDRDSIDDAPRLIRIMSGLWPQSARMIVNLLPMFIEKERNESGLFLIQPPRNERAADFHLRKYGIFVEIGECVAFRPRRFLISNVI